MTIFFQNQESFFNFQKEARETSLSYPASYVPEEWLRNISKINKKICF